ncbi:MAG TPA: DUF429 domain-containing protein [Ktedonobacterales bacterium]
MTHVAGLDLAAGRGHTALAMLEIGGNADAPPCLDAVLPSLATDAEIVAALALQQPEVLAIDAPLSLPARVAAALGLTADDTLNPEASPYTRAAERDPVWRALGVRPLPVSFLGGLTFRALALLPLLRAALPETAIVETFPSGTLAALGIRASAAGGRRPAKTTPQARAIVQAGLRTHISGLPDPAAELLDADTLDALACALTAVAFLRGAYRTAGDAHEGQIILPT